jgi:hypothetical protein
VRQPTGPINLTESVTLLENIVEEYDLGDDYEELYSTFLTQALNVSDMDAVAEIMNGALYLPVQLAKE